VRPNPIGISTVRLDGVRGSTLDVDGVDMLDGTPLLDIKPYVPDADERKDVRVGWLAGASERWKRKRSDGRFG
jgi:tRNA (Thr-GGU) A37 N-methylase